MKKTMHRNIITMSLLGICLACVVGCSGLTIAGYVGTNNVETATAANVATSRSSAPIVEGSNTVTGVGVDGSGGITAQTTPDAIEALAETTPTGAATEVAAEVLPGVIEASDIEADAETETTTTTEQ